ncbi:MAG: hydroxylamine reductase [Planctomycetia bacterium]|nr:hydroxylamine reductase [Planctomycetia bacterium]
MFCYQCQEALRNEGCTVAGMCGKKEHCSRLMDTLMDTLKGLALAVEKSGETSREVLAPIERFLFRALFATLTNTDFDEARLEALIREGLEKRQQIGNAHPDIFQEVAEDTLTWNGTTREDFLARGEQVGILATEDEDRRSLQELLLYGMKGIAAYAEHASVLGMEEPKIGAFLVKGLASTLKDLPMEERLALVLECGNIALLTMETLDQANTRRFGHPRMTTVLTNVGDRPGILISGHDLLDLYELLEQTRDTGIDIYTHGEMLPAHAYPELRKFPHLRSHYGSSWWHQNKEFASFQGPILMTTNCITPVQDAYRDRIFTTGSAGFPGVRHIPDREAGKPKDFSEIIALAQKCPPPLPIPPAEGEKETLTIGMAHDQVLQLQDKILEAVQHGKIRKFVVMAGCDGRHLSRQYFTDVAQKLPPDTVILTAGCAKFRYNRLDLGEIDGIPRVLDAGQCNDSFSWLVVALRLKEVLQQNDVNDLPLAFDIAWYEQKAVAVLLALLAAGIREIHLGPTLPAFLSPNVLRILVEKFHLRPITDAENDVSAMTVA